MCQSCHLYAKRTNNIQKTSLVVNYRTLAIRSFYSKLGANTRTSRSCSISCHKENQEIVKQKITKNRYYIRRYSIMHLFIFLDRKTDITYVNYAGCCNISHSPILHASVCMIIIRLKQHIHDKNLKYNTKLESAEAHQCTWLYALTEALRYV